MPMALQNVVQMTFTQCDVCTNKLLAVRREEETDKDVSCLGLLRKFLSTKCACSEV